MVVRQTALRPLLPVPSQCSMCRYPSAVHTSRSSWRVCRLGAAREEGSRDAESERKVKGERLRRQQQNQITNGNSVGQQWDESWSSCAAPESRETEAEAEASCDDITPRPGLSQRAAQCSRKDHYCVWSSTKAEDGNEK